jgi:hypothetical protein
MGPATAGANFDTYVIWSATRNGRSASSPCLIRRSLLYWNLCADDIATGRALDVIQAKLEDPDIHPRQVWLEATERGFIDVMSRPKKTSRLGSSPTCRSASAAADERYLSRPAQTRAALF